MFYLGSGGSSSTAGIVAGSVVGGILLLVCCIGCLACSIAAFSRALTGRAWRSNTSYINSGVAIHYNMSQSVFIPGTFATYYYQYNKYHGPYDMRLGFYPQASYIVHGGGTDDIGTYVITGVYSPRTLRMGLDKRYQRGTGNLSENLGHTVTIQVEWNAENQQFEGKYYLQTSKHRDENTFIIRPRYSANYRPYTIQSPV